MNKSNFQRTATWLAQCGKYPNVTDLSCQIGCHMEELLEFLRTVELHEGAPQAGDFNGVQEEFFDALATLEAIGNMLKKQHLRAGIPHGQRVAALDALCDSEVTGNGVAFMAGFLKDKADEAVLASNEAKLVDGKPVILPGGKIGKPEGWTPPQLEGFV